MMNAVLRSLKTLSQPVGERDTGLQAAALCLRDGPDGAEVLLVTSLTRGRWVLPKGWPMKGRTLAGAALREAWEEAGVQGAVQEIPVGAYVYDKLRKSGLTVPCNVQVFRVAVQTLADDWPEAKKRRRAWYPLAEAAALVDEPGLAALLRAV
jgi:8-oxo-dGTP pyrophosphatase MutT (NUDIX family)